MEFFNVIKHYSAKDFRGFGVYNPLVFTLPHPPDTATVVGWRVQLVCSLDIWVVPIGYPSRAQFEFR